MKLVSSAFLASIALVIILSTGAHAQSSVPGLWDQPLASYEQSTQLPLTPDVSSDFAPSVLRSVDPDRSGYPMIDNWNTLNRDVRVFLNDTERQGLTRARVDQSVSLQPIFRKYVSRLRSILTPRQSQVLDDGIASCDMEKLSAMSRDDWTAFNVRVSQRLHLDGFQQAQLSGITDHLMADVTPIHAQYAAALDSQIAAADARIAAESAMWHRAGVQISTPPPEATPSPSR